MPTHAEIKKSPFSAAQMYALVADMAKYPEFLPWCVATRVRSLEGNHMVADMVIGFKMIREKYTSEVTLDQDKEVKIVYKNGPFKYLHSHWKFEDEADGGCTIDFFVDFEFRSALLQKLMGAVFNEAVQLMIGAFEKRALELYGTKA
ncbi:Oligoketide cyclase/lipid transport protein [Candidatus Terasakiella magnetica]|uniref:Oligoketide cyclase/lipid transport protein n=1 Tax=Candidatus Terasakiella magnetica TaxID=1867952 RepID=A0A1C3RCR2_9PROT|nr:type II toxin-antitoxin system RatA family toxin [Candidatus Terasakiella magnetica]SCA55069.1 Oligoketide cyclase/lipid transport protein [Candidatus Terasakiella magnetica]